MWPNLSIRRYDCSLLPEAIINACSDKSTDWAQRHMREKVTPFVSCPVAVCDLSCFELFLLEVLVLLDFPSFGSLILCVAEACLILGMMRAKHLCESLCGRPRWLFEATA